MSDISADLSLSDHKWLCHIRACAYGQFSMRSYAQKHDLDLQEFYHRKGELIRRGLYEPLANDEEVSFDFLPASVSRETPANSCQIRFPNGLEVTWPVGAEASVLRDALQAVDDL